MIELIVRFQCFSLCFKVSYTLDFVLLTFSFLFSYKGFYLPKAPKVLQSLLFNEKKEETISMIFHLYSTHLSSKENKENQPLSKGKPFYSSNVIVMHILRGITKEEGTKGFHVYPIDPGFNKNLHQIYVGATQLM
jgi:hypothetical protein